MKILLTGSSGQLGTEILRASGKTHEMIAHHLDLDVTDRRAVADRILEPATPRRGPR